MISVSDETKVGITLLIMSAIMAYIMGPYLISLSNAETMHTVPQPVFSITNTTCLDVNLFNEGYCQGINEGSHQQLNCTYDNTTGNVTVT